MSLLAIRSVLFCCLVTLSVSLARAEEPVDKKIAAPFVHVALYTFKADAPEGTAAEFAAEAEKVFAQIDTVRSFRLGQPAAKATPREFMVDPKKAYHLGVVLTFDNFDGMAKYGNDQRHNELKKKYAKYFEKIVAYDFEDAPSKTEKPVAATAKLSGLVTLDGQTVPVAIVQLHLKNGQFSGSRIVDGRFGFDNIPAGEYVVSIAGKGIPAKYSTEESSALKLSVQPGENAVNFDLRGAGADLAR
ncbi:Dabb family protein [Anatilimnocola sp. NA78]|uniref:Dabb family protein n=1 Tax=Anatilimnocola sp. NA78 TaxID=3415683 RepID=UPI003CE55BC3